jgi:hypothetical protein
VFISLTTEHPGKKQFEENFPLEKLKPRFDKIKSSDEKENAVIDKWVVFNLSSHGTNRNLRHCEFYRAKRMAAN